MDEFGVFTEGFGIKPQGKSAPMAASKGARNFGSLERDLHNSNFSSYSVKPANDLNGPFPSADGREPHNSSVFDHNELFSGSVEVSKRPSGCGSGSAAEHDSIFGGPYASVSNSSSLPAHDDETFDLAPGLKSSTSALEDDLFASISFPPKSTPHFNDILWNLDKMGPELNDYNSKGSTAGADDLLSGFGGSSGVYACSMTATDTTRSSVLSSLDELEEFAIGTVRDNGNKTAHEVENQHKNSDDLESFCGMDEQASSAPRAGISATKMEAASDGPSAALEKSQADENDLELIFGINAKASSVSRPKSTAPEMMFDDLFNDGGPVVMHSNFAGLSMNTGRGSTSINSIDDFSFMFGAGTRGFQEIEGENEDRRGARWKRHQETTERMEKAVADMNRREFRSQQEQEERNRIADTVNTEIKLWTAGKEGNLRALLSTLQCVLWPECHWQPVPLTDLITSTSVKKYYKKASLYIHPDKVQQKGFDTKKKYVAEKVFDLLKEAWNKFDAEELH